MAYIDDIYQKVTDRIVTALEEGTVPWHRPLKGGLHKNFVSKKTYRGVNQFLLDMTAHEQGYEHPYWMTFKQAKSKGGSVRKGEKSTLVIFFKPFEIEEEVDGKKVKKTIPLLRSYRVFNIAQCDGIDTPEAQENEGDAMAQLLIDQMPDAPEIVEDTKAFYDPEADTVHQPDLQAFTSSELYYHSTYRNLVHSTGHEDRLDRFYDEPFPTFDESLLGEIGAAMLCAVGGVDVQIEQDNAAAYIKDLIKRFKANNKLVVRTSSSAQRAVDSIIS